MGAAALTGAAASGGDALAAAAMAVGGYYVDPAIPFDVIVIGGGTAGMPLAIEAAKRGKVLVIESSDRVGGTLFQSGGLMSAAGSNLQKRRGVVDTPDMFYEESMAMSHGKANAEINRLYIDHSALTVNWLEANGLKFGDDQPGYGAHAAFKTRRYHWGPDGGRSIVEVMLPLFAAEETGGRIRLLLNTAAAELTQTRDGAVTGVIVTDVLGRRVQYRGRNVVLTAGGMLRNPAAFRKHHKGRDLYAVTANDHSRGQGAIMAEAAGANISGGDMFIAAPGNILPSRDFPQRPMARAAMAARRRAPWEVYVNASGSRFVAEDADTNTLERAHTEQPRMCTYVVFDQRIFDTAPPLISLPKAEQIRLFDSGHTMMSRGATLEEAARKAGLPPARLAETVAAYNKGQASGADALGRKHMPAPVSQGPFYVVETYASSLMTWAGVDINKDLQVVDAQKKPIPNLYAAGENTGVWQCSGDVIVNGCGVTPAITLARLLGSRMLPI